MIKYVIEGRTVSVYPCSRKDKPVIYLNTFAGEGEQVYQALCDSVGMDFTLAVISDLVWERDMIPWDVSPVSENDISYKAGADEYLQILAEKIVPKVEKEIQGNILWRGLAGYSLAGMFAFYVLYQTNLFSRIASISGSLWFPGFKEYVFSNDMKKIPDCLYLSLGDKEDKTKNPYFRTVREYTEQIANFCQKNEIDLVFQLNSGNHFQNSIQRAVDGIVWLLKNTKH